MGNSCDLLIKNGSVVLPRIGIVNTNIMIENGRIKKLAKSSENVSFSSCINATGKFILPGLIDPHVHYGVYTPIEQAANTESRSAAIGGVTTMIRMLRLYSSYKKNISIQIEASNNNHFVDYKIHPSILREDHLSDIPYLIDNIVGINSFKVYMNLGSNLNYIHMDLNPGEKKVKTKIVNMNDEFLHNVVKTVSSYNCTLLVHAEDPEICYNEIKKEIIDKRNTPDNQGQVDTTNSIVAEDSPHYVIQTEAKKENQKIKNQQIIITKKKKQQNLLELWSRCRPYSSEVSSIKKISSLARLYNSNLYFVHIGSSAAIDAIVHERELGGCNLYIETCPHYLTHTFDYNNLKGKVVPPLRSKHDVQSIWYALRNGIIDTIGTDHVANRLELKIAHHDDLLDSLSGFPGIATMLPVLLSEGVNKNRISLDRVSEVTSYNTARIFGLYPQKGTIKEGSDADLVIVDLNLKNTVSPELLQSYSDYSIYDGWELQGWPITTISRGKVIMEDFHVNESLLGHGKFTTRSGL